MTIDIDFDVYKVLTQLRSSESVTYNDVLRKLLKIDDKPAESNSIETKPIEMQPVITPCGDWITNGVTFPEGTLFRANHKGRKCEGIVKGSVLVVDGIAYDSPSGAATAITGSRWNGWRFWECQFPGKYRWVALSTLRKP